MADLSKIPSYNKVFKRVSGRVDKYRRQQMLMSALSALPQLGFAFANYRRQGQWHDEEAQRSQDATAREQARYDAEVARQDRIRNEDYERSTIPMPAAPGAMYGSEIGPMPSGAPIPQARVNPQQMAALRQMSEPSWEEKQRIEHENRLAELRAADEGNVNAATVREQGQNARALMDRGRMFFGQMGGGNALLTPEERYQLAQAQAIESGRATNRTPSTAEIEYQQMLEARKDPQANLATDRMNQMLMGLSEDQPLPEGYGGWAGRFPRSQVVKMQEMLGRTYNNQRVAELRMQIARETDATRRAAAQAELAGRIAQSVGGFAPLYGSTESGDVNTGPALDAINSALRGLGGNTGGGQMKPLTDEMMTDFGAASPQAQAALKAAWKNQGYDLSGL